MPKSIPEAPAAGLDRRRFLTVVSGLGVAATALPGLLWAEAEKGREITPEVIAEAEKVAGLTLTEDERKMLVEGMGDLQGDYETLRELHMDNGVAPALRFDPAPPGTAVSPVGGRTRMSEGAVPRRPTDPSDLAFLTLTDLARLVASRRVSSVELTRLYLERLRRYDPLLHCLITPTEERALEQAERADREIAAGHYRGPLHGIPWGAKDLLAVRGYRTTWGAKPYEDQVIDEDATVVRRLDEAGAVLVGKLSLGALAWGDVWFGGMTRNPWNPEQGSSGSSAGPAAAAAGGLCGFTIGSETLGSIVSPSTRCGATGLRPTFGRVSRHGAMALSWSMDKLGPICRSVEDCALVFDAIYGADGRDATAVDLPFAWNPDLDPTALRVGYVRSLFEAPPREGAEESHAFDLATLDALRRLGIELVPVELPDFPVGALSFILSAEAAAAFDDLTLSGRDDLLVRQIARAWPNVFRQARFIPAVEYIQANRARTLAMRRMAEMMRQVDVYVVPSFGGTNLLLTNLTGHPTVVLPNGFRKDGTPSSISFVGDLYGEDKVLTLARAYQEATGFHRLHPDLDAAAKEMEEKGKAEGEAKDAAVLRHGYRVALSGRAGRAGGPGGVAA